MIEEEKQAKKTSRKLLQEIEDLYRGTVTGKSKEWYKNKCKNCNKKILQAV